jgi:hypothetical protein
LNRRVRVKKLAIISFLVLTLLAASCRYITGEAPVQVSSSGSTLAPVPVTVPGSTPPQVVDVSQQPFLVKVSADPVYLPGESIIFGIWISNLASGTITIDPFPPAMQIKSLDSSKIVYSEPAGNRTSDIGADSPSVPNKDFWDQRDNSGQQVAPGRYELTYEYVIFEQATSKKYTANPSTRFTIADPNSAMTKDLDINQSVTNAGLTVTLQSLELNAVSGTATIFYNPPGLSVPEGPNPDPSQVMKLDEFIRGAAAEYRIDSGENKQLTRDGAIFNKNGITLKWKIDPVPLDAKELTLTVTNLGGLEGRWEFKVPLR